MTVVFTPAGSWYKATGSDEASCLQVFRWLDKAFSYYQKGYYFSEAFRARRWDGKIHLVHKRRDGFVLPTGVLAEAASLLRDKGYSITVHPRERPPHDLWIPQKIAYAGPSLRPYQLEAVVRATKAGRGILKLPVRSGKTTVAAALIPQYGWRTLFVVSAEPLLHQAAETFELCIPKAVVTRIGDGCWDASGDIVVATIQALFAHREEGRFTDQIATSFPLVFLDEVHHLKNGGEWRDLAMSIQAHVRFGLSATVWLEGREVEPEAIWLHALCGPIICEVTTKDLIEEGFLVQPTVRFIEHGAQEIDGRNWTPQLYDTAVVHCVKRNVLIAREAVHAARAGRRTLVDVSRVAHAKLLGKLIADALPPGQAVVLTGKTSSEARKSALQAFRAGQVKVIVGTILGEGVDIPELEVVVNAEAGKARTAVIQRLRNLTTSEGKTSALIIEMADLHHPHLARWTKERLAIYESENTFKIEVG